MRAFETSQFEDANKYASYLKTPLGTLRSDLAWENLRASLPSHSSGRRALDVGGGTGTISLRLAKVGYSVTLLDPSEGMLEIARQDAAVAGVAGQITFLREEACGLQEAFAAERFDVVVCHNVLEFVESPERAVFEIKQLLRSDGVLSILVRNRAGEAFKAAVKSNGLESVNAVLSAETVLDSLYGQPMRLFEPQVVTDILSKTGLALIAQRGVRVFADYRNANDLLAESTYRQLLELELLLGARPELAAIARYTQIIAQRKKGDAL